MKILLLLSTLLIASFTIVQASAVTEDTFHLTVRAEPNILFITGSGDYKAGSLVTLDSAPETWRDYSFVGWMIDGRWSDENPLEIRMDMSHSVEAVYEKTGLIGGIIIDTIPRVSEITIDGTIYLPSELPLTFSWTTDSEHVISLSQTVSQGPATRYLFDSWKDQNTDTIRTIKAAEDASYIALYKIQHYIKPISEQGAVLGAGWQDAGTMAQFELESDVVLDKKDENIRYVFNSWTSGDYPNSAHNTIPVAEGTAVKATWDVQNKLQLQSNIPDYNLFGTGWYDSGKQVALIAEESLESPNADTKYVFDRWVSRGPNPVIIPNAQLPSTTIIMDQPYVIEAQYKKSFQVNVWTPFGDPVGAGFYDQGAVAEISLSQTEVEVEPNNFRKVFSGWDTHGARTMDLAGEDPDLVGINTPGLNLLVFVDQPVNVTANWKSQYYLDVQTTQGKVKGAGWYDIGRMVPISVEDRTAPAGLWSAHTFDRWTGDIESTSANDRVLMNGPKNVIAEWKVDNTPGITNGIILAAVAGIGAVVYTKTRKGQLLNNHVTNNLASIKQNSFDKFFALGNNAVPDDTPSFYTKPPMKKSILDWLLGRGG